MIPLMALAGVTLFVCSVLALWPVWGLLTPLYLIILSFGASFSMMFLPSGFLGNLCFWVGTIAFAYFSHTLPHDPVW